MLEENNNGTSKYNLEETRLLHYGETRQGAEESKLCSLLTSIKQTNHVKPFSALVSSTCGCSYLSHVISH